MKLDLVKPWDDSKILLRDTFVSVSPRKEPKYSLNYMLFRKDCITRNLSN